MLPGTAVFTGVLFKNLSQNIQMWYWEVVCNQNPAVSGQRGSLQPNECMLCVQDAWGGSSKNKPTLYCVQYSLWTLQTRSLPSWSWCPSGGDRLLQTSYLTSITMYKYREHCWHMQYEESPSQLGKIFLRKVCHLCLLLKPLSIDTISLVMLLVYFFSYIQ